MDLVKEAFLKVKEDISLLNKEVDLLKENFLEIKERVIELSNIIINFNKKLDFITEKYKEFSYLNRYNKEDNKTNQQLNPTNQQLNPTNQQLNPTNQQVFKPLNNQILDISIGNEGVPTDKQTNQQTNQQTKIDSHNQRNSSYNQKEGNQFNNIKKQEDPIDNALIILNSLDNLKKELRLKFKKLTEQEMLVFSNLYQLDSENGYSDYKQLSQKLNLSESSIRDYIGRLIQKGIPIEKIKVNNKNIQLKISQNLKKIASLNTIVNLREI